MQFNSLIKTEITSLAKQGIDPAALEKFAIFVIDNHKKKDPKPKVKPLTLPELKAAIYGYFSVKDTVELKKSGSYKMVIDGLTINLSVKDGWEKLYRKLIGILPHEQNEQGYGCVNGINVFNYSRPWDILGLDPKSSSPQDIKAAYYALSKIYHPDVPTTGDAAIFDRLNTMYKSISAEA